MDEKEKQIRALLEAIKSVESSGGHNLQHQPITRGVNAGDSAMGQYGMTPNTMKEMLGRNPQNPYSDLKDSDLSSLYQNESNGTIPPALQRSPLGVEGETARNLADYALKKQQGDVQQTIASWLMGHNTPANKMGEVIDRSPAAQEYVEKAMPVYEKNFPKLNGTISKPYDPTEPTNPAERTEQIDRGIDLLSKSYKKLQDKQKLEDEDDEEDEE